MAHHAVAIPGVRCLVVVLLLWSLGVPAVHAQAQRTAPTEWQFTPLVENVYSPPRWFTGTDGKVHLVYELYLTNGLPMPAIVNTVAVLDANSGATLLRLTGPSLLSAMSLVMPSTAPNVVLPPATVGVVWLDVPLASKADIPEFIAHRVTIDPVSGVPAWFMSYTGPRVAVDRRPPVVVGPPVSGSGWFALGSCCDGPHRRALLSISGGRYLGQRFAIDFNQLDAQNRAGVGDPRLPATFPTFGQPVLAVADATVAVALVRQRLAVRVRRFRAHWADTAHREGVAVLRYAGADSDQHRERRPTTGRAPFGRRCRDIPIGEGLKDCYAPRRCGASRGSTQNASQATYRRSKTLAEGE
jgi:hypothetical protein